MMRGLMLLGLPAAASAVHLSGPMNDAMVACGMANCPEFMALMAPGADVAGTGLPLSAFLAPPLNAVPFIYNMDCALNVMGWTNEGARTPGPFNYRATPNSPDAPVPQDQTATATEDKSAAFACMCHNCGAMVESIFQPVGRSVCQAIGADPLPCQTEFDACQAATTRPTGTTGSAATFDLVYPTVSKTLSPGLHIQACSLWCVSLTTDPVRRCCPRVSQEPTELPGPAPGRQAVTCASRRQPSVHTRLPMTSPPTAQRATPRLATLPRP